MFNDKITLNIAEAVKKVLNTEGRIDDLRDNKKVRDDTDWYHDKSERKEKKKETSNVKTHVGKYGKSNFKSMSEDSEELNESAVEIEKKLMHMALKGTGVKLHDDHTSATHKGDFVVKDRGAIVGRLKKGSWEHTVPEKHKHIFVKENMDELEENEQLNELSKKTLDSYIKKTSYDVGAKRSHAMMLKNRLKPDSLFLNADKNKISKLENDIEKRKKGIKLATKKLTSEDSAFSKNLEILSKQGLKGIFEAVYSISEETEEMLEESADFVGIPQSINTIRKTKEHLKTNKNLPKAVRKELEQKIDDHRKHLERAGFDFKESLDFDQIDFDALYEAAMEVISEEPDNDQFTKEVETAKKKAKGELRNDENIAKGKVDAVKVEEQKKIQKLRNEEIETLNERTQKLYTAIYKHTKTGETRQAHFATHHSPKEQANRYLRPYEYVHEIKKYKNIKDFKAQNNMSEGVEFDIDECEYIDTIEESTLTDKQMEKREEIVKGMKKNFISFKERYGDNAKNVMYATATKQAKKED